MAFYRSSFSLHTIQMTDSLLSTTILEITSILIAYLHLKYNLVRQNH